MIKITEVKVTEPIMYFGYIDFFTRLLLKIEKKIKPVLLRSVKIVVSSVEIS